MKCQGVSVHILTLHLFLVFIPAEQKSHHVSWSVSSSMMERFPLKHPATCVTPNLAQAEEHHKVLTWAFSHMHMHTCAFFMPTESWLPESPLEQSGEKTGNQHHVTMREESRRNAGVHAAGMTVNTPVISLHLHKCRSTASNLTLSDR